MTSVVSLMAAPSACKWGGKQTHVIEEGSRENSTAWRDGGRVKCGIQSRNSSADTNMAKQNGTPKKPSTNEQEKERLPAYFLSLTLENVRCFGPKQTLNLSTKEGNPRSGRSSWV